MPMRMLRSLRNFKRLSAYRTGNVCSCKRDLYCGTIGKAEFPSRSPRNHGMHVRQPIEEVIKRRHHRPIARPSSGKL